jgi:hypothetical protein
MAGLVAAVGASHLRRLLLGLVAQASLGERVDIDAETAAGMVRRYRWLLERVGEDGIKLTSAGYLPPAVVRAAMTELELRDEAPGAGNREHQSEPVLFLRRSAQAVGLLRKNRGTLLLTSRGRALRDDPVALWWRLAEQTPPKTRDVAEMHAGLFYLLTVAAGVDDERAYIVADLLGAVGWRDADGSPVTPFMASDAAYETTGMLRQVGGFAMLGGGMSDRVTEEGALFARAALRTWP